MSNTETKTTIKAPFVIAALIALGLLASMVTGCSSNTTKDATVILQPKAPAGLTDKLVRYEYRAQNMEMGTISLVTAYQPHIPDGNTSVLLAQDSVWVNDKGIVDDVAEDAMMFKILELHSMSIVDAPKK